MAESVEKEKLRCIALLHDVRRFGDTLTDHVKRLKALPEVPNGHFVKGIVQGVGAVMGTVYFDLLNVLFEKYPALVPPTIATKSEELEQFYSVWSCAEDGTELVCHVEALSGVEADRKVKELYVEAPSRLHWTEVDATDRDSR